MENKLSPISRSSFMQPFNDLLEDMFDHFDDNFFRPFKLLEGAKAKVYPRLNIYNKDSNLVVEATVPGLAKEDVKVTLDDETKVLTISGQNSQNKQVDEDDYYMREITKSAFSRSLQLPSDLKTEDCEKLKASFKDGLLKIEIPYKEVKKKVKQIAIE